MRYFLIFTLLFFLSNASIASSQKEVPNYLIFEKEGKQGLKDKTGQVLIPAKYDELGWSKGDLELVQDVVGFKKQGLWGLVSIDNQIVAKASYDQLYPAGQQLLVGAKPSPGTNRVGLLNTRGQVVIPFNYTEVSVTGMRVIVVKKNIKDYTYGLLDFKGNVIIPIEYKQIATLGGLRFTVKNFNDKTAIYSDDGRQIVDFELDSVSQFNGDYAIIYEGFKRGLVNKNGEVLIEPEYQEVFINKETVEVRPFNLWHVLSAQNELLDQINVQEIALFSTQLFLASANERMWLIRPNGEAVTGTYQQIITPDDEPLTTFRAEDSYGVINIKGDIKIPARYDSVYIDNDMIFVQKKNLWSLYDSFNIRKTTHFYQQIAPKSGHLFPVKKNHHWGFIDRMGKEIIHCVYDEVGDFSYNKVDVKFHGERGIIDKYGDWIVLPHKADSVSILNNAFYMTYLNGLKKLKDFEGDLIYFTENPVEIKDNYLLEYTSEGGIWKVDFSGQIVEEATGDSYEEVRKPSEGFYAIKKDGSYGFIDAQNRLRIANRYENVGDFHQGLAAFQILGKWGFIDKRERIVIQPVFQRVSQFYDEVAVAYDHTGSGLINKKGEKISSFSYDSLFIQPNGHFQAYKNNKIGLLDSLGRLMINAKYDYLRDLDNGFAIVRKDQKYGVVDYHGVNTIPIIYDKLIHDSQKKTFLGMKKSSREKVLLR
ncbi:WG repeat-containing protein [Fulvivirga sp. RKSG066]|uniref:WG repeat-containing protein n=1 Tax=Fulvivirga aurantia TaxID=2529383 RepID=UPI0012BB9F4A|nr:WG repeat-containing protein [Fulvivirga aurantia]MTI21785.1 WG repeat-containing protein [Fulvivirga aurantia]